MLILSRLILIVSAVLIACAVVILPMRFGLYGFVGAWLFVFGLKPFRKDKALWEYGGAGFADEQLLRVEEMVR